jgi:hypothetical protein
MKYILLFLLLIIEVVSAPLSLYSDSFSDKQRVFIKKLYREKRYFDAISETRRLIYYLGDSPERQKYEYFILSNYYLGKQYKSVIFHLNNTSRDLNIAEKLLLSRSYLKAGLYSESSAVLKDQEYGHNRGENYRILLGRVEPLLYMHETDLALDHINKAEKFIQGEAYKDLKKHVLKYPEISYRSPVLGGILSAVVPGSGQVYSGKYLSGFISLLGVAAAAAGTWYYNEKGDRGLTYSMGFFTMLFYTGNIYAGYNSARGRNLDEEKRYFKGVDQRFFRHYTPLEQSDKEKIFHE